jgi:quercetin dioxygenase-like cupin family protein
MLFDKEVSVRFPKIYADESGETHFGFDETPDLELALGPPPNPVGTVSDFGPVNSLRICMFPAGTAAPAHTAPQPYVAIVLGGEGEVITSDGVAQRFRAGDLLLCSDLTGRGHITRAVTDLRLAFIQRAEG